MGGRTGSQIRFFSTLRRCSSPRQPSESGGAHEWQPQTLQPRGPGSNEESREEARRAYQEAIRLRPTFVEAHLNLGLLHHDDGNLKEGEACYRRALRYSPALAFTYFNLAVVLEDQYDTSEAVAAYKEALRSDPMFREAMGTWHSS